VEQDFLRDFAELSSIGAVPGGGVERQAGTAADGRAREWLAAWLGRNGFAVTRDRVGNLFGTLDLVPGAPHVLLGSHLDSQPSAGRFDGAYGVLAAAHAARRVADAVRAGTLLPRAGVAVVDWFNEEGSRFQPSLMGSSAYVGATDVDAVLGARDAAGTSVAEALTAIGARGDATPPTAAAYAEIHIEQGRQLERRGVDIGLVETNWAARKYEIVVHGVQGHTGATVLEDRHDALLGAARVVCLARDVVDEFPAGQLLTAVGRFTVTPNSPVVVPGEVRLSLDVRSLDPGLVEQAHARLLARFVDVGAAAAVDVEVVRTSLRPSRAFSPGLVDLAEAVAAEAGVSTHRMPTMAGHDAVALNTLVPTALLFVPSVDGVSHDVRELTHDADLLRGVDVLGRLAERLVGGAVGA
jgi:N-carbamoyl-L-amino-acid hydrolase